MLVKELISEEDSQKLYFAISSWGNPYRRGDEEYFMVGPYESSAAARKAANVRLERGQPSRFTDWASGSIKVVEFAKVEQTLTKMKLQVPKAIKEKDIYDEPALWRLREV